MMALPSLWVASGEAPAQERFANVHYRRAFLLLRRKSALFWTRVKPGRSPRSPRRPDRAGVEIEDGAFARSAIRRSAEQPGSPLRPAGAEPRSGNAVPA